jgi:hypothetical protein
LCRLKRCIYLNVNLHKMCMVFLSPPQIIHHHPTSLPPLCLAAAVALFLTVRCVRTLQSTLDDRPCSAYSDNTSPVWTTPPRGRPTQKNGPARVSGHVIVPLALRDRSGPTRITLTSRGTTLMDSIALVGDIRTLLLPSTSYTGCRF